MVKAIGEKELTETMRGKFKAAIAYSRNHLSQIQNNSSELEDSILYLACENSRKEGFLSELDSQSLLENLPQGNIK
jgi:hypothetical protein